MSEKKKKNLEPPRSEVKAPDDEELCKDEVEGAYPGNKLWD